MPLKLLILLISSVLKWVGGKWNHNAQRIALPLVLGTYFAFKTHCWWILPALSLPMGGFIWLGYGQKSAFRHIFGDGWGRGVWGLLVALAASCGLLVGHFLAWWLFIPYLALNFTLENALKKLPQDLGDPIIGAGFGSLVFLV